jgi:histidinol phosphatase-like PHP family hydrolase
MKITSDWHIHSRNSCDEASMEVSVLIKMAEDKGVINYGLTDHIHTPYNMPDLASSHKEFMENNPSPNFHFGVEISCVSQWEIDEINTGKYNKPVYGLRSGGVSDCKLAIELDQDDIKKYQIEYVVGGTHWPMYVPIEREAIIRDYHRQNMFLVTHPLVDIVAHPWWWHGHWQDSDGIYRTEPWFDDFGKIPKSMHNEFASSAIQHNKIIEINISAMLLNPQYTLHFKKQYLEYIAELKSQGVKLCIGSDCHSSTYDIDFETTSSMLDDVYINEEDLWCLPERKLDE